MAFEHRMIWSTRHVKRKLIEGHLSEAATFYYGFAIFAFDWLQFTYVALSQPQSLDLAQRIGILQTPAVVLLSLIWTYRKNGGKHGADFYPRYFALTTTVGWKILPLTIISSSFVYVAAYAAGLEPIRYHAAIGVLSLAWNVVWTWRIGKHLQDVAKSSDKAKLAE